MKVLKKGKWVRLEHLPDNEIDEVLTLLANGIKEHGSLKALVEHSDRILVEQEAQKAHTNI